MSFPFYLARRIHLSGPAIRIATAGVAIGVAVMIVTVAVVMGFKHTVRGKLAGFGSHIQVSNALSAQGITGGSIALDDSLMTVLRGIKGVAHVQRYAMAQGILKTDDDFLGVAFKGLAPEQDTTFLASCMVEGSLPHFSDSTSKYPLVVSLTMARRLHIKAGQRLFAYFIDNNGVRARRFTVTGIYQTNMKRFDDAICLTDLCVAQRLNGYDQAQCSGAELLVSDFGHLDEAYNHVLHTVNHTNDSQGGAIASQTIHELYPQVFAWLDLLDLNVWVILALMIAVAGFTMISGLLIIILERTQMIGLLKALGARTSTVRHTFLWFAVFIIGRGLLWGNVVGIGLVVLQRLTGIIRLDPQTYYVSEAPMELSLPFILLINAATLLACVLVLVGPSYIVAKVSPAKSMRYE